MMKKNIYLFQPSFLSSSTVYFPYAAGALASYAWSFDDIKDAYELKDVFFLREKISNVINSLREPFLAGFSNYIWNFEYNKNLAKRLKELYPQCITVFGGPQISPDADLLSECPYIDILIYHEGETAFRDLLRVFENKLSIGDVSNISYRTADNVIHSTEIAIPDISQFPSPFESGFFDRLSEEHPDIEFVPLIETNRGCPNRCAYCSWGRIRSGVRFFPMERVFADIEWASRHKADFLGIADANFGMFPRDEIITDKIIECYEKYGYPRKFQVSYSKDTEDRVFRIAEKLNKKGMDKGVTLSFQSMSDTVQKNIGRPNIDTKYYKSLMKKYSAAGIPTYTDLILGLPGETPESFRNGIDMLLENGQHISLFIHLCEWLPLAEMANKDYMEDFGISFTKIPLNQPHTSAAAKDDIPEYSRIVTSCKSMTTDDWKEMVMFSTCVLCFHHLGLLQLISLYLRHERSVSYSSFYSELLEFMLKSEKTDVFRYIKEKTDKVIEENGAVVIFDDTFGDIAWPFEEYAFLKLVSRKDAFYQEIREFLKSYIADEGLLDDLIAYQKFVVKSINVRSGDFYGRYDWRSYFRSLMSAEENTPLTEKPVHYVLEDKDTTFTWPEYARKILWYGRRGGKNIYTSEIHEEIQR